MVPAPDSHTDSHLNALRAYSACDISDALVRLGVPGGGFVADLSLVCSPPAAAPEPRVTVAPASTVLFGARASFTSHGIGDKNGDEDREEGDRERNGDGDGDEDGDKDGDGKAEHSDWDSAAPPSSSFSPPPLVHWADLTEPGTFVVLAQPDGQTNAVCGGIVALRAKLGGVVGMVVVGRVRDRHELEATGLPIWARGLSTVGAAAANVTIGTQVPLSFGDTTVRPGDYVVSDPANGVVVVPRAAVGRVLDLLPRLVSADDAVRTAVADGMAVSEAFATFRSNI